MIFGVLQRAAQRQCRSKVFNCAVINLKFRLEEKRRRFTIKVVNGIIGPMEEGHHGYFL